MGHGQKLGGLRMLARGAGTTTVCWREIFTLMSVGMITKSAVAVPTMARSALFSPASGGGEIWLSCRSRQRKVTIVGNALEAHSAKWVAKQANKEGSMKFSSDVGPDGQSVVGRSWSLEFISRQELRLLN